MWCLVGPCGAVLYLLVLQQGTVVAVLVVTCVTFEVLRACHGVRCRAVVATRVSGGTMLHRGGNACGTLWDRCGTSWYR